MSYEAGAHIVGSSAEFTLSYPTTTTLSKVQFCQTFGSNYLAASGWDGFVRIFDVGTGSAPLVRQYFHTRPVLCCTFTGPHKVASGGLDKLVKLVDLETGNEQDVGGHSGGIRCMEYNPVGNVIVSGGWDRFIKLWDGRGDTKGVLQSTQVSGKVYAMDVLNDQIICGTSDRRIFIFDMRNLATPLQERASPLKFQTRAIAAFPQGDRFAVSSIEGRVAIECVENTPENKDKKFIFKSHRIKTDVEEEIYPVNDIAIHPTYKSFATGGSDCYVNIWDPVQRKRLVQFHRYPSAVCSMSFSASGHQLAVGTTELQDILPQSGRPEHAETFITIRKLVDGDVRVSDY